MGLSDLCRFVQFACTLGLFGTIAWPWRPRSQVSWSLGSAALYAAVGIAGAAATIGWLFVEARTIGGSWSAIGAVVTSTRFGQVALLRAALLVTSAALVWGLPRFPAARTVIGALAAVAVVSFIWTGHGTAGAGAARVLHIVADALHLFCAAVWIGALVMLSAGAIAALAAARRPSETDHSSGAALVTALSRFSAIGPALIGLLIATGVVNAWLLIGPGHWSALVRQPYGWTLIAKLVLFAAMLALGARHRYRSTPALREALASGTQGGAVLGSLRATLLIETLLAMLVLAAVAVLGNQQPPASIG